MFFADHMLIIVAFWTIFDLSLTCKGDLKVDVHQEDIVLCLVYVLN
ncbi:hypothetical protein DSUL_80030 [Desulfovibrionales bacterium]